MGGENSSAGKSDTGACGTSVVGERSIDDAASIHSRTSLSATLCIITDGVNVAVGERAGTGDGCTHACTDGCGSDRCSASLPVGARGLGGSVGVRSPLLEDVLCIALGGALVGGGWEAREGDSAAQHLGCIRRQCM
jgi:hypothetical protein